MQVKFEPINLADVKKLFGQELPTTIHNLHLDGLEVILNMQPLDFNGKSVFKIESKSNKIFRLHCHQNPTALGLFMEKLNPTFKVGKSTQGFFIDLEQSFVLRVKFKLCEINLNHIPDPVLCKLPKDLEKEHLAAINYCFSKNPLFRLEFRKENYNPNTKEYSGPVKSILFKFPSNAKVEEISIIMDSIRKNLGDALGFVGLARDRITFCFDLNPSLLKHKLIDNVAFAKSAVELGQSQLLSINGLFNSKIEAPAPAALAPVEIPNQFLCPITMDIMIDPVIIEDGYTYERTAIVQYLSKKPISPMSRAPVNPELLIPNRALKELIEQFVKDHPEVLQDTMALPMGPQ